LQDIYALLLAFDYARYQNEAELYVLQRDERDELHQKQILPLHLLDYQQHDLTAE